MQDVGGFPIGGRGVGIAAGLVAAAAFATSGPVIKPLLAAGWSPSAAILVRLGLGTVLLAGPALAALRGRYGLLVAEWRTVLLLGVLGVAVASGLYYQAVARLPVAVALLVEYTAPLMLVALAWARTRRPPALPVLAGAGLAMGGLALVLDLSGAVRLDPVGLLFALGAAVGNATYFACAGRPTALPPLTLVGAAMAVGTVAAALPVAVGVLPVTMPAVDVVLLGTTVPWWLPLLVVGLVPTAFAYGVSSVSVRVLGERVASFLALSEVLFAVLLAWLLVGERPTGMQAGGALLVVGGVALVRRGAAGRAAGPTAPVPADDVLAGAAA